MKYENKIDYIEKALKLNFDCEIDIHYDKNTNRFSLGHDSPENFVDLKWLEINKDKLWIHCKNLEALEYFVENKSDLNYFWHENDRFTLTSKNFIWTLPGEETTDKSVIVNLENNIDNIGNVFGICSDYIYEIKNKIERK